MATIVRYPAVAKLTGNDLDDLVMSVEEIEAAAQVERANRAERREARRKLLRDGRKAA